MSSSEEKQYDGRIGDRMQSVIMHIEYMDRQGEVYKSQWDLAQGLYGPQPSTQYGYALVKRMYNRGWITVDPDHPDASPTGKGAIVITDEGREYVEYLRSMEEEN